MEFFELMSVSHRYMELLNPSTSEKIVKLGKMLGLKKDSRVIDFGCGCAEPLALWAEEFGITATGIDISTGFCDRARKKVAENGLSGRIEIVCCPGTEYQFEAKAFDAATCIGATFVFGGYRETVQAMKRAIKVDGKIGIGETYWLTDQVPPEIVRKETSTFPEPELLQISREEGFDIEHVVRASQDDWDRYYSDRWYSMIHWLKENPAHPDHQQVLNYLHTDQDDYFRFIRPYVGWAMYVLVPAIRRNS
jgi:cyclopropane fatty-acyl-phospholipid synthase-like methyltransferase